MLGGRNRQESGAARQVRRRQIPPADASIPPVLDDFLRVVGRLAGEAVLRKYRTAGGRSEQDRQRSPKGDCIRASTQEGNQLDPPMPSRSAND